MTSVGLRRLVPLIRVFPVRFSADSAESAGFRERWFNALNEADFAESSRDVVDSPSNRVRRPARTTETSWTDGRSCSVTLPAAQIARTTPVLALTSTRAPSAM